MRLALLAAWAGGGCYRSHALAETDGGSPDAGTDAAPSEDAAPVDAAPEEDASPPDEWEVAVAASRGRISYAEADVTVDDDGTSHLAWIATDYDLGLSWLEVASYDEAGEDLFGLREVEGGRSVDFDPTLCTTPGGDVVLAGGCYDFDGQMDGHVCVTRSADGGRSFDRWTEVDPVLPPDPDGRFYDRPWLSCAADGTVWMTVTRIDGDLFYGSFTSVPLVTMSEDGGRTWHELVEIATPEENVEITLGVGATTRDDVAIGVSYLEDRLNYALRADGTSWPPTVDAALTLAIVDDIFPSIATDALGGAEMVTWSGALAVAPASSSAFASEGALGPLGVGPDVTCGDISRGGDCLWAAWLQGSWATLEWQVHVSHRCGAEPFAAPRVVPDEPFVGTPHVTFGGTTDEWFGHFIGIDVALDGSARIAWVDTRDGTNTVRLALMR